MELFDNQSHIGKKSRKNPQQEEVSPEVMEILTAIMSTSCDPTKLIRKRENDRYRKRIIEIFF